MPLTVARRRFRTDEDDAEPFGNEPEVAAGQFRSSAAGRRDPWGPRRPCGAGAAPFNIDEIDRIAISALG